MNYTLDLTRKVCHVCGHHLKKDYIKEIEWCCHSTCQVYMIEFSIPYKIPDKEKEEKQ